MHNPFTSPVDDSPETEAQAAELFGGLSGESLPVEAATSIRESMLSALVTTGRAMGVGGRFAFAGSALVAPLLAIGAVSAAAGESPVDGTVAAFESAASAFGVGGKSADTRQDLDARNEAAEDFGQPGSQPGNTANAPGLTGELPTGGSSTEEAAAADSEDGDEEAAAAGSEASAAAHDNGKGCDDTLFAAGDPPFATPGGPVGCEVGNSADHRQNGVNHEEDGDTATTEGDEDSPGGVSRGLGRGHDEDKPGEGVGAGHEKHEHEPNENGHGPGGPGADEEGGDTGAVEPAAAATSPGASADHKPETAGKKN